MIQPPPTPPAPRPGGEDAPKRHGSLWLMKSIDNGLGLPICTLFGLLVWVRHRLIPRQSRPIRENGTIVVSKFFGIGTIVEATALLVAIRQRYPGARLVFLTFSSNASFVRSLGLCTDLLVIRTGSPILFAYDTLRHVIWMRRHDVDVILDLEFFSKFSTLMSVLGGARMRVGYHLNAFWRSSLLTHPVYFNYYRHITSIFAQAGSRIDIQVPAGLLRKIPVKDAARERVAGTLRELGWADGVRLVGVNVNAGELSLERRWPVERFVAVIEALIARHPDVRVLLTGSPVEAGYVGSAYAQLSEAARGRTLVTAGLWTMEEFLAALERMACILTNDSGPMHLAAAQGTPLVTLWGPGRPDTWAPAAARQEIVYEDYPCSPCIYMFTTYEGMWCKHEGWCMLAITVARTLAAVEAVLGSGAAVVQAEGRPS
jgi:ADP-heptose:LPS heptosyltransferase